MTFKNILVALDGSKHSQIAADYGFRIAADLDANITGIHVADPRLVDLFLEREFAEELGLSQSAEASETVYKALRKVGALVLDLFNRQAINRGLKAGIILAEGYVINEIVSREKKYDLLVIGHRGRSERLVASNILLGSVAERLVVNADIPVLIAMQPISQIKQIVVAYDGSEPARGALLMAENLAKNIDLKLRAIIVNVKDADKTKAKLLQEEGESYLREYWPDPVFIMKEGMVAETLLSHSAESNSLLVLGAYGFKEPDRSVLGSTTTKVIRESKTSVLVYKPNVAMTKATSRPNEAKIKV